MSEKKRSQKIDSLVNHRRRLSSIRLNMKVIFLTVFCFGLITTTVHSGDKEATPNTSRIWTEWQTLAKVSHETCKVFSLDWRIFRAGNFKKMEVQWRFSYHSSLGNKVPAKLRGVMLNGYSLKCTNKENPIDKNRILVTEKIQPGESRVSKPHQISKEECGDIASPPVFDNISKLVTFKAAYIPRAWSDYGDAKNVPSSSVPKKTEYPECLPRVSPNTDPPRK